MPGVEHQRDCSRRELAAEFPEGCANLFFLQVIAFDNRKAQPAQFFRDVFGVVDRVLERRIGVGAVADHQRNALLTHCVIRLSDSKVASRLVCRLICVLLWRCGALIWSKNTFQEIKWVNSLV